MLAIALPLMAICVFLLLHMVNDIRLLGMFVTIAAVGIVALKSSMRLFVEGKEIEPVRPLTAHNQHQVPLDESLLRASDAPPSHQQAELLRAVKSSQEMPPEELLRAAQATRENTN